MTVKLKNKRRQKNVDGTAKFRNKKEQKIKTTNGLSFIKISTHRKKIRKTSLVESATYINNLIN